MTDPICLGESFGARVRGQNLSHRTTSLPRQTCNAFETKEDQYDVRGRDV